MIKEMTLVPNSQPHCAVLIKDNDLTKGNKTNLLMTYIQKLAPYGVQQPGNKFTFLGLQQHPDPKKKVRKADAMKYLNELLDMCDTRGIDTLLCTDAAYFLHLTGNKLEANIGNRFKCTVEGFEHITVLPSINYNTVIMYPNKAPMLDTSLKTISNHLTGTFQEPGSEALKDYKVIKTPQELKKELQEYLDEPDVACDIETTSLRFYDAEILTIAFAKDEHTAIAVPVSTRYIGKDSEGIIEVLKWFFDNYQHRLWFHNALYDVKVLIYALYMSNLDDFVGMQKGLDVFEKNTHDTMIVAYLAKNSTMTELLSLKELTKEYLGNYGEDVKEAVKIPLDRLLKYNAKDCIGTIYVRNKYLPLMIADKQQQVYSEIMRPSIKPLLKMMLTGLPLDLDKTDEAETELKKKLDEAIDTLRNSHYVKRAVSILKYNAAEKYNSTHKVKKITPDDVELEFNPNSSDQLRLLIFDILGFEVIEKTKGGQGSTKREFIEEYLQEAEADGDEDVVECLQALIDVSQISIIINTFISAFKNLNAMHPSGYRFLKGNLKLGGTQSGRLSSNEPNMQNLPSGSKYGKIVKSCFIAPKGWLFAGADFSALEDRIGAILSGDSAKTKEFAYGFDGHSLRALAFFPEELPPGLSIDSLEDNKRIKKEYGDIRGKSKGPSFAMQYGCGPGKIQQLLKCTKGKADEVYKAYHSLYSGLSDFADGNKQFGIRNGYVEGAFGLRLRTPILKRYKPGTGKREPKEVGSEARSASNMVTQSWGMLMNRAFIEFNERLEKSKHINDVRLINTIHDAVYLLVRQDPEAIKWVNDNLVECMQWQDGKVASDEVKMEAELDIGLNWKDQVTLHNNATVEEIQEFMKEHNLKS